MYRLQSRRALVPRIMAVTIKRVMLWQTEIRNEPGAHGAVLEPLAQATSGEPAPQ